MTNDINAIMSLAYTKLLKRDEDGEFVASIAEFPGCSAHGATESEALEFLNEVMSAWIEERLAAGLDIPRPQEEEALPSGKWVQRVSRSLHQALIGLAKAEGVSLNQLVTTVLAEATARRRAIPMQLEPTRAPFIAAKHPATFWLESHQEADHLYHRALAPWTVTGAAEPTKHLMVQVIAGKMIAKQGKSRLPTYEVGELEASRGR